MRVPVAALAGLPANCYTLPLLLLSLFEVGRECSVTYFPALPLLATNSGDVADWQLYIVKAKEVWGRHAQSV